VAIDILLAGTSLGALGGIAYAFYWFLQQFYFTSKETLFV
jgi:hypothetical protein